MTDQINGENTPESTEGRDQNQVDLAAILDKLNMHSEVLAKLADAPDTVNADGLRHLSEQVKPMIERIQALPEQVQTTVKETVSAKESEALGQINELKLALTRREIMQDYGFGKEDEKLFAPYKTAEEIKEVAESLSARINQAKPKSSVIQFSNSEEAKVPPHLQHLRSQ